MVNGGQALARLNDGRYVFVWNALPGEVVIIRVIKEKKNYVEAVAEEVIVSSKDRRKARDSLYLSTSPWQIMSDDLEIKSKLAIVKELFLGSKINFDDSDINIHQSFKSWFYRNKMEYSFWGDETGLHLAHYARDSHHKQIIDGSSLAMPQIDRAAIDLINVMNRLSLRASSLKSVVIRSDQSGRVNASLFVKDNKLDNLLVSLPISIEALRVYYSNPKSPANVITELITTIGQPGLTDSLNGLELHYDADSFFQVNLGIFNQCLKKIQSLINVEDQIIDIYGGVGSIGLSVARKNLEIVEINEASIKYALMNAELVDFPVSITHASAEQYIANNKLLGTIILDPPRAGLSQAMIDSIMNHEVRSVIYLSCNPATLARDLSMLQLKFSIQSVDVYNFFPKTPHIETLVYLTKPS